MLALIIDDSRAMRGILKKIVEPLGFTTVEAGDGAQGMAALAENPAFDLVLVDWNMPVMNGLEFVKACRSEPAYKELRIVMVTTETEPHQMVRALMAGIDEFVMKPFTADILVEKLKLIGVPLAV